MCRTVPVRPQAEAAAQALPVHSDVNEERSDQAPEVRARGLYEPRSPGV